MGVGNWGIVYAEAAAKGKGFFGNQMECVWGIEPGRVRANIRAKLEMKLNY